MILELELAAVVALQALGLRKRLLAEHATPRPVETPAAAPPHVADTLAIVKRQGSGWVHIGFRHPQHSDVHEALRTPGLAIVHPDGRIEEGK